MKSPASCPSFFLAEIDNSPTDDAQIYEGIKYTILD